jgi:hypothetical protein
VLLARPHDAKVETVNDKDGLISNFWRATTHAPDEVAKWADWPVNEADLHARHRWLVEQALPLTEKLIADPDLLRREGCRLVGLGHLHLDRRRLVLSRRPGLQR